MDTLKKELKGKFVLLLCFAILFIFVYRGVIFGSTISWGDSPHYYQEEIKDIIGNFSIWSNKQTIVGGVDGILWIKPLMIFLYLIYGIVGSSDAAIRLVFYMPTLVFGLFGIYQLSEYFKNSKIAALILASLYFFNTYFLLLVDGGQIGVMLAYGLFPFVLWSILNTNLLFSISTSFVLSLIDPRIYVICLVTALLIGAWNDKRILIRLVTIFVMVGVGCLFWVLPILNSGSGSVYLPPVEGGYPSILNAMLLYSTNWPDNVFGQSTLPQFFFVCFPVIASISVFFKPTKKDFAFLVTLLVFIFAAKGANPPFGFFYKFITTLPFGFAFRDSSKFFVPVIILYGIIIAGLVDKLKNNKVAVGVLVFIFVTIYPAIIGSMNFVLSNRTHSEDYNLVYQRIKSSGQGLRTVWIPERHPLVFETEDVPAIEGKRLVDLKPFADMNTGTYDRFNFFANNESIDWLSAIGVKYIVLADDARKVYLSDEEIENKSRLQNRLDSNSSLTRDTTLNNVGLYELTDTPQSLLYSTDNLYFVVGPIINSNRILPAVYAEDGKLDAKSLLDKERKGLKIVFNNKDKKDLKMSLLQNYFINPIDTKWAKYSTDEYLLWKYQLLIRGLDTNEFDYGRGILLSTNSGEETVYDMGRISKGEYQLEIRLMGKDSQGIKIISGEFEKELDVKSENNFGWVGMEINVNPANNLRIVNLGGTTVVNTLALIPKADYQEAISNSETFVNKYDSFSSGEEMLFATKNIKYTRINSSDYEFDKDVGNWIVFLNSYHTSWKLTEDNEIISQSYPLYSFLNVFYSEGNGKLRIVFADQAWYELGSSLSCVFVSGFIFVYFIKLIIDVRKKLYRKSNR